MKAASCCRGWVILAALCAVLTAGCDRGTPAAVNNAQPAPQPEIELKYTHLDTDPQASDEDVMAERAKLVALLAPQAGEGPAEGEGEQDLEANAAADTVEPQEAMDSVPNGWEGLPDGGAASELAALRLEVEALRGQVSQLEQHVRVLTNSVVAELKAQNRDLRRELQRVYAAHPGDRQFSPPPVPMPVPGHSLFEAIHGDVQARLGDESAGQMPLAPVQAVATASAGSVPYTIVKEWGRTPEEAAQFETTSLKGLIAAVKPGLAQETLEALGGSLRGRFTEYDSINIEVFDDAAAAKRYVEENAPPGEHRLMAISKHPPTGRDLMVIFTGQGVKEIPFAQEEDESPEKTEEPGSESPTP